MRTREMVEDPLAKRHPPRQPSARPQCLRFAVSRRYPITPWHDVRCHCDFSSLPPRDEIEEDGLSSDEIPLISRRLDELGARFFCVANVPNAAWKYMSTSPPRLLVSPGSSVTKT